MSDVLDDGALARWRREPHRFIAETMNDPETGKPFVLLDAERAFLDHAFRTDDSGRLIYPEQLFSAPKKSGKTAFAALHTLTTTLIFGGPSFPEGYCIANDLEQAQGRVFAACRRIVEVSPLLRAEAKIYADRIEFSTGATISAIASDYAGAAGANPTISAFDELWAFTSERSRRLWDEMVPPPTRKIACRLITTYAGFTGESVLLEELYRRGQAQPQIGTDLYGGDGLLMFWSHEPIAPWQTVEWIEAMRRQLRPNAFLRMIRNEFASVESAFVDMDDWDRCVDPDARPVLEAKGLPVWIAVDASTKRDSSVVLACAYDHDERKVRLIAHRVFQPTPNAPLNFETTIETTVKQYCDRYHVQAVHYDPWNMASPAQRLRAWGAPMAEFAQTPSNLTAIGSNLYELIRSGSLIVYPDDEIRLAISRAVARETDRGFTIGKSKASHKIDLVIALAMAAKAVTERGPFTVPLVSYGGFGVFSQPRQYVGGSPYADDEATANMLAWNRLRGIFPHAAPDGGPGRISARSGGVVW